MANRFSQISTSSFKPLSLDEIMAVPLAKQAQHDETSLALDEFSKMEANSLDQDKEYVTGQIQALQKESDDISNQLLDSGVNRNLSNKLKSLRNRKNQEFSLQGKTGQASAAYNEYKANEAEINKRTDMTAEMKRAGLAKAKADYLGVAQGGTYNPYVGTAYQDATKKAYAIAEAMTPSERAEALGMVWDSQNGFYVDGDRVFRELKPEHIQRVAYQGLKADTAMMEYANEYERLGMGSAEDLLSKAAVSAGNVYQVNILKETANYRGGGKNNKTFDDSTNMKNPMDWSSRNYATIQQNTYDAYGMGELSDDNYDTEGNLIIDPKSKTVAELKAVHAEQLEFAKKNSGRGGAGAIAGLRMRQEAELENLNRAKDQKQGLDNFREDFKYATKGLSDKEVGKIYSTLQKDAASYISEVSFPENPESTFNYIKERVLGEGDNYGDIMSRQFHFPGEDEAITGAELAERYGEIDEVEMMDLIKKGTIGGISPYDPVLPMGFVLQFSPDGEEMKTVIVSNDNKMKRLSQASKMTENMLKGKSFDVEKVNTPEGDRYIHYLLKLNVTRDPETGEVTDQKYEPYIMYSENEMKRGDIEGVSTEELENKGVEIYSMQETANHELQVAQRHYDGIINKKTTK